MGTYNFTRDFCFFVFASRWFGIWAFLERQDYKNNSDTKAEQASIIAVQNEGTRKDEEFIEREKNPYKTYQGPDDYGSLNIQYPKT